MSCWIAHARRRGAERNRTPRGHRGRHNGPDRRGLAAGEGRWLAGLDRGWKLRGAGAASRGWRIRRWGTCRTNGQGVPVARLVGIQAVGITLQTARYIGRHGRGVRPEILLEVRVIEPIGV